MPTAATQNNTSLLQGAITNIFLPRFAKGSQLLYVCSTDETEAYLNESALKLLGIKQADVSLLPGVIAFDEKKGWLYLSEVSSDFTCMTETRISKLKQLLFGCKAGLIFISAFLTKQDYIECIPDIAWESEVWLADNPEHMIHFNGDKFLGPYKKNS
jgi:hypothetical protein